MHKFRCILATFFAILIVIPACCCASIVRDSARAEHSCCEGGKKEKRESACDCEAKTPRNHEAASVTVDAPVSAPAEPMLSLPAVVTTVVPVQITELPEELDTGPPRRLLAMLQRFLI
ncbi:hypothetical protein JIN84_08140 [Luteolibacter yonseiensis]|uniref:Lipoprotein n=1 Tax=Luteolibacter yonseiensis TaxID=1144680 RepID=A0A934R3F5_9BACT|nr:hypothetical protein [Luteolibacter yonseiensis]MBK1815581.1 hypothetical protein [Luteolibacter yonseiensis]